jgi:hypothetical protein
MKWLPLVIGTALILALMVSNLRPVVSRILITLILFGLLFGPYRADLDRWAIEEAESAVSTVDTGNQFTVRASAFLSRTVVLADTALPAGPAGQRRAKAALEELIAGRRVGLALVSPDSGEREPWRVRGRLGQLDLNRLMVERGHLAGTGPLANVRVTAATPPPQPVGQTQAPQPLPDEKTPAAGMSLTLRYVIWAIVGIVGATSLGMTLNRKRAGVLILLGCVGSAIYFVIEASKRGTSVLPPVVGMGLMFLLGGPFAKSQRERENSQQTRHQRS